MAVDRDPINLRFVDFSAIKYEMRRLASLFMILMRTKESTNCISLSEQDFLIKISMRRIYLICMRRRYQDDRASPGYFPGTSRVDLSKEEVYQNRH